MNNALFTIEQVDNKLMITVELVKPEHPNPTMIRSNDGNTETIEFVDPPLIINTNQGGLDLSKYKPFPEGYVIPKGKEIRAVKVYKEEDYTAQGTIGTIIGDGSDFPIFKWDNKSDIPKGFKSYEFIYENIKFLAPLDPSDHPDYKAEEPDQRPMNADEISDWVYSSTNLSRPEQNLLKRYINEVIQYELNKAKR